MSAGLAPPLRIRRRNAWQRRYADRADAAVVDLLRFATLASAGDARSALAARLPALRAALLRSPYYCEALQRQGLSPRDLLTLDELRHFPLLDRETLAVRSVDLPALELGSPEAEEAVFVQSSGSTGDPLSILRDPYDCLHMWSVLRFLCVFLGVPLPERPRVVLLCSLPNGIEYSVRLPLLRNGALHRISLQRPRPLERLRRARPDFLFSDPAGLHWLAAQPAPPQPRLVLTSAQHFAPEQRARLARAVPAPVVNYYASTDTGPLAWECLDSPGRFHVLLPDAWLEEQAGELVVTRLRASVLPLLRYRTGDRGFVEPEYCACGYRGFSVTGFTGRRECHFRTPDGRRADAWQLAWLFTHYPLRAFRLTQHGGRTFELQLVHEDGPPEDSDLADRLGQALGVLGFDSPEVRVRAVDSLTSAGEKPEPFRCAIG